MLKSLLIRNYALIQSLDMDFHEGFSVITGETGAGKSIMLGAIGLLLGQRADQKSIRDQEQKCVIEAKFQAPEKIRHILEENDIEWDDELIVRREILPSGKSRSFINDTPAQLSILKEVGDHLIDIHSQHKNLLLSREDFQMGVLDMLSEDKSSLADYRKCYSRYTSLHKEIENMRKELSKARSEEEFLRFQYKQLDEASLSPDELDDLESEEDILSHAEEIKEKLYAADDFLEGDEQNVLSAIKSILSALQSISEVYQKADEWQERLESSYIELKDIAEGISSEKEEIEFNPARLEYVTERINLICSLEKKHNAETVSELIEIKDRIKERLDLIDLSDNEIEEKEKELGLCLKELEKCSCILSAVRRKSALEVERQMSSRLIPLGMPNVQFKVDIRQSDRFEANGKDKITFLFNANKGGAPSDLSQVASGGEIARVMLALKAMVAKASELPTIIFDEIDTGVSGQIAGRMAEIMQEMGNEGHQVISITHLPQIAARGTEHFKVYKEEMSEHTVSHIIRLDNEQRVTEIANMLSGENISEAAIANAKDLLASSK